MRYKDRQDAGRYLARKLYEVQGNNKIVIALPRGGVILGVEVAKRLNVPLDVLPVCKIGHPHYPEYAIGTVADNERPTFSGSEVLGIDKAWLKNEVRTARRIIKNREKLYRGDNASELEVKNKTVLLIDDGMATGLTMKAAVAAMQVRDAKRIVIAVPIASSESIDELKGSLCEVVTLDNPRDFLGSVGSHYRKFKQVTDEEVRSLLRKAQNHAHQTIP